MQPQSQTCLSLPPRETQGKRHLSQPIRKSPSHQEHPTRERQPPFPLRGGTDVRRTCLLLLAQRRHATSCPLDHTHSPFRTRNRSLLKRTAGSRDRGAISREFVHLARSRSPCLFFLPEPGFSPLPPRRRSFFFSDRISSWWKFPLL